MFDWAGDEGGDAFLAGRLSRLMIDDCSLFFRAAHSPRFTFADDSARYRRCLPDERRQPLLLSFAPLSQARELADDFSRQRLCHS